MSMLETEGEAVFCAKTGEDIKALVTTLKQIRVKTITMCDVMDFLVAN
jgi:hypothetical protein